ncbi:MAG: phosphoribosylanthranilate isomerase [Carboxydocellales bacterium]
MTRVKICGITDLTIALGAVAAGADAIGFVFAESRRRISPNAAQLIIKNLPPFVTTVGVFVDEALTTLNEIANYCGLDVVQLHGSESPQYCQQVKRPVLKAIRIATAADLEQMAEYEVRGFLLDTFIPGQLGGTGQTFPWHLARAGDKNHPIIVAGGLTPDNVQQALAQAEPFGVDVSSGVETDGIKDLAKIQKFINRVRRFRDE